MVNMWHQIINQLIPTYCGMCSRVGDILCSNCIKNKVNVNWQTYCCVCNTKVKRGLIHEECKDQTYLDGHIFMFLYDEGVKELVTQGKYSFYFDNFRFIGSLMSKYIKLYHLGHSIVVPIPSTQRKRNLRGFNQAEIIARELGNNTSLLKRIRDVPAQAELSGEERRGNLRGVFQITNAIPSTIQEVLLVDDVYTTGSTLNECAKVLKENGVEKVYGYTFAKSGGVR